MVASPASGHKNWLRSHYNVKHEPIKYHNFSTQFMSTLMHFPTLGTSFKIPVAAEIGTLHFRHHSRTVTSTSPLLRKWWSPNLCSISLNDRVCQPTKHSIQNNKIQMIQYNSWQVSNSYMFRHRSTILRNLLEQKNTSPTCQSILLIAFVGWYGESKDVHLTSKIKQWIVQWKYWHNTSVRYVSFGFEF